MSVQRVIDNKKIGANIRLARVKKMMSQSELAKLLGVTMLNQLTNLFDVETDSLLYGTPAIRPKAEAAELDGGIENYTLGDLIKAAKLLNGQ